LPLVQRARSLNRFSKEENGMEVVVTIADSDIEMAALAASPHNAATAQAGAPGLQ